MARYKNPHIGGEQLPLLTPGSDWTRVQSLPDLRRCGVIALDRECNDIGLSSGRGPGWAFGPGGGHVSGVSVAWRTDGQVRSAYLPIRHQDTDNFSPQAIAQWERDHQKAGVRFVMQNAPYDVGWGDADLKVGVPPLIDDTTCMAYMIDENRFEYNLDALCQWRGIPGKDEKLLREAFATYGFENDKKNIWRLPARYVGPYAEADAVATLLLYESLLPELAKEEVEDAYRLEMDLLPVVHAMRKRGIRVDLEYAEQAQKDFREGSIKAFEELSERLGQTVGIHEVRQNSWLEKAFTDQKEPFPRNQDGRGSFDKKWMQFREHWLPQLILKGKGLSDAAEKFVGTFVMGFAHSRDGRESRLHASINQFRSEDGGTRTYRFSYADPPLQQMPNRDDFIASRIRGCFLPEPGEVWLAADYSQQEYRLIVHYAELLECNKAFDAAERYRKDPRTDFHSMVAEMTGLERKPAKDANFAKSYGAGIAKFAAMIRKSEAEAEAIMTQYDKELPFNKEMNERCQKKAEQTGFIRLLDGARIHFDNWEPAWLDRDEKARGWGSGGQIKMGMCRREEAIGRTKDATHPWYNKRLRRAECRKAMNSLIQGGAARQTKAAMRAIWNEGFTPLIQMHDELGFSIAREQDGARVCQIMREVIPLLVPMMVDAEYGPNWGQAKSTFKEAVAAL